MLPPISIIVAVASNYAIGKDNQLLWHIPEDLKRFKELTYGHVIIMGKRTWESLPRRPLPGRTSVVLSDQPGEHLEGAKVVLSIEEAIQQCRPDEENFIIGGGSVYRQFLPLAARLYLTRVHQDFEGDTFFPEPDPHDWVLISREDVSAGPGNAFAYSYEIYERASLHQDLADYVIC